MAVRAAGIISGLARKVWGEWEKTELGVQIREGKRCQTRMAWQKTREIVEYPRLPI
jgi:hypothetical protein